MNLVDSSGWLEYLVDGSNADAFSQPLRDTADLLVPTLCVYEVFKVALRERGDEDALRAMALMTQGVVVDLSPELAILAAKLSLEFKIPMADSIVLATARSYDAIVWTKDADFKGIKGVKYFPR
jgi:predicted nucleic acid-binding protein